MSSNLDVIRSVYQAFAVGNIPAVLAALSPNVRWTEAEGGPYGGVSIGPNAVLENVFMKLGGEWDGFAATPQRFHDAGNSVVVEGRYTGTCKATGKPLDAQFCHVWIVSDGKLTAFQQYTDTAQMWAVMTP